MHVVHWIVPLFSLTFPAASFFTPSAALCTYSYVLYMKLFPLLRQPHLSDLPSISLSFSLLSDSEIYRLPYTFSSYNETDSFQFLIMYVLDVSLLFGILPHRFVVLRSCLSNPTAETKFTSSAVRTSFA